jgi:hypothetical protein
MKVATYSRITVLTRLSRWRDVTNEERRKKEEGRRKKEEGICRFIHDVVEPQLKTGDLKKPCAPG